MFLDKCYILSLFIEFGHQYCILDIDMEEVEITGLILFMKITVPVDLKYLQGVLGCILKHYADIHLSWVRPVLKNSLNLQIQLVVPNHHLLMVPNILKQQIPTCHVHNHRFIDHMAEIELLTKCKQFYGTQDLFFVGCSIQGVFHIINLKCIYID